MAFSKSVNSRMYVGKPLSKVKGRVQLGLLCL